MSRWEGAHFSAPLAARRRVSPRGHRVDSDAAGSRTRPPGRSFEGECPLAPSLAACKLSFFSPAQRMGLGCELIARARTGTLADSER